MPHDLPQLQHAILGALLGFGGPKRLGDGQDGLSSMVTGHVSFANTDNIGNFAVFHFGGLFLILYQPIRLSKHVRTARVRHLTPIHDSSGIAFHDAAATGDVDIQQRMEEHLAHCALLTAVAQDAAGGNGGRQPPVTTQSTASTSYCFVQWFILPVLPIKYVTNLLTRLN